jgi:hypothetical protein
MPGWILKQATFRGSAGYRPRRRAAPGAGGTMGGDGSRGL